MSSHWLPSGDQSPPDVDGPRSGTAALPIRTPQRTGIPRATRAVIGREQERAEIQHHLLRPEIRLVSLVGPGGIGKTTLALDVAAAILELPSHPFSDGIALVALASATAEQVPVEIAAALNIAMQGARPTWEQLLEALRDQELLLVLDNLEHLLADTADTLTTWIERLLVIAPGIRLLVTSRERLRLNVEWVVQLGGLEVPPARGAARVETAQSVRLFVERARQVRPDFSLSSDNRGDVARICRQLEGMPLAIELAASWARVLAPGEIALEIERALDFLVATNRDVPARHRGMRAALDHSWSLLNQHERQTLARLAVFRGGFERDAAAAVGGASLPALLALIEKSLVRREEVDGVTRFTLHELVRQYAAEHLAAEPGLRDPAEARHRAYYAAMLRGAIDARTGQSRPADRAALDRNIDNLRAAWRRAAQAHDGQTLLAMARGMRVYFDSRGWLHEAVQLYGTAAEAMRASGPAGRDAYGLLTILYAFFLVRTGRLDLARPLLQEGRSILQADQFPEALSELHYTIGIVELRLAHYDLARAAFEQVIALAGHQGDLFRHNWACFYIGRIAQASGEYDAAAAAYQTFLETWRGSHYQRGESIGHLALGEIACLRGAWDQAAAVLHEALRLASTMRDPLSMGLCLTQLGVLARGQGQLDESHYLCSEAAEVTRDMGDTWLLGLALCERAQTDLARHALPSVQASFNEVLALVRRGDTGLLGPLVAGMAALLAHVGAGDEALELLHALDTIDAEYAVRQRAAELRQTLLGRRRSSAPQPNADARPLLHRLDDLVRRTYSGESAPALVAQPPSPAEPASRSTSGLFVQATGETLSAREIDVLRLLISGAANQEIANTLVISLHTAKHHVANILQKLGVATRTQAALRGRALGLEPPTAP